MTTMLKTSALNFRDVAGFPAAGGSRVRPGILYRCAAVDSPDHAASIGHLGVSLVCDLRSNAEQHRHPSALRAIGLPHADTGHDIDLAAPVRLLRDAGTTQTESRLAMIALYARLPKVFSPVLRRMMAALVATDGPVIIHCAAGKDRTGIAVALLLTALGVAQDDILKDFLASNSASEALRHSLVGRYPGFRSVDDPALGPLVQVESAYLDSFFGAIGPTAEHLSDYLAGPLGLDRTARDRLAKRMLA
ncbi:MAG: tyrosine-protein phosphatase [Gemmobacter sp.]|nr:tyrosine-protein phosphatase [Gemmobacter sp.]